MSDVDVHLNIAMTPRVFGGALFFLLLGALPRELASEAVTLNSYYPAPSGIYTQMISTGNTFLARDGGFVGIGNNGNVGGVGTLGSPASTTGANSTKLIVLGGKFGIGTPTPAAYLEVKDPRNAPLGIAVNGQILTGDGASSGGVYLNSAKTQYVGTTGSSLITLTNGSAAIYVDNAGNVGIGVNPPSGHLDVNGIIVGRTADVVFSLP